MTSRTETARPVNPRPAVYRRGQSVHVLGRSAIGVVVDVVGARVELAIWPQSRLRVSASEIEPLSPTDACPRSLAGDVELVRVALARGQHCMPRSYDGRCHWCARELAESHEHEHADGFEAGA